MEESETQQKRLRKLGGFQCEADYILTGMHFVSAMEAPVLPKATLNVFLCNQAIPKTLNKMLKFLN